MENNNDNNDNEIEDENFYDDMPPLISAFEIDFYKYSNDVFIENTNTNNTYIDDEDPSFYDDMPPLIDINEDFEIVKELPIYKEILTNCNESLDNDIERPIKRRCLSEPCNAFSSLNKIETSESYEDIVLNSNTYIFSENSLLLSKEERLNMLCTICTRSRNNNITCPIVNCVCKM